MYPRIRAGTLVLAALTLLATLIGTASPAAARPYFPPEQKTVAAPVSTNAVGSPTSRACLGNWSSDGHTIGVVATGANPVGPSHVLLPGKRQCNLAGYYVPTQPWCYRFYKWVTSEGGMREWGQPACTPGRWYFSDSGSYAAVVIPRR